MEQHTFDIMLSNSNGSNTMEFKGTIEDCEQYIKTHNRLNTCYFSDFKGGKVSIVNNATGEIMHEERILTANNPILNRIKDIISRPSEALQAMVDGLQKQSKRSDFIIQMDTFGDGERSRVCFGCAATCAIQQIARVDFIVDEISTVQDRSLATGFNCEDLEDFEEVIDRARKGDMEILFLYFDLDIFSLPTSSPILKVPFRMLTTQMWEKEIPKVKEYIETLKRFGY